MPLLLTAPPLAEPVSLAEAKAHLRITHNDDDAYVSALIVAARRAIEQRTSLRLLQQGWSLFLDQWPQAKVASLHLSPVMEIDDIITYGEDDTPAVFDPAHYYLDAASRPARAVLRDDRLPPRGGRAINGIEIRFKAGFGTSPASVPQDLKQALLLTLAHWFSHRGDGEAASPPLSALATCDSWRERRLA